MTDRNDNQGATVDRIIERDTSIEDARLLAALTAYETKAREQDGFPAMATPLNLTWFSDASADRMRAALRAAGEVRS